MTVLSRVATALAATILAGVLGTVAHGANPNALWEIVHDRCVPGAKSGNPAPCIRVGPDDAVLKDIVGHTQFLLIPTARITGIEDPALLASGVPNYFGHAWQARNDVEARAGHPLPRSAIALAINPPGNRSQNQLHIHVDCIRPDVRNALRQVAVGPTWALLPEPLEGQHYTAMRLKGDTLDQDPVRLLADGIQGARGAMEDYTLVVAGVEAPAGFILLAGRIGLDGPGHGEDLQDHDCGIANEATPPAQEDRRP